MGATDFAALFAETERKYGRPSGYLSRTAQIDSGMNPNAKNPKSSAGGLFQSSTAKPLSHLINTSKDRLDETGS